MDKPPANIYPVFAIEHIQNPNRFWAIPLLGGTAKIVILVPIFIEIFFICLYLFFISFINSLVVLFSGKYWQHCFNVSQGLIKFIAKTQLFFLGLTDKYPGFNFTLSHFQVEFTYPQNPNRLFAIPIFGGLARIILLTPYFFYLGAISNGGFIGTVIGSFFVLFKGRYPETSYELARDSARLGASEMAYIYGISDKYPSFHISMNHPTLKILLIILGASNMFSGNAVNRQADFQPNNCNYYNYSFNYEKYRAQCAKEFNQLQLQNKQTVPPPTSESETI